MSLISQQTENDEKTTTVFFNRVSIKTRL